VAQPASSRDASTTHWATIHLLPLFGAIPVNERVVVDGAWVFAAGVTAGIDGALRLAAELRGNEAGEAIQLHIVFAPEPPFPWSDRYFELRQTTPTHLAAKVRAPLSDFDGYQPNQGRAASRQLVEQRLGFFQIECIEALGEPAID
jgi:hypothetical protein